MAKNDAGSGTLQATATPAAEPTPASTPAPEQTVRLQYDHTYNGVIYLRGEHTVDADTAGALTASEDRVTERMRQERDAAGQIQTINGPIRFGSAGRPALQPVQAAAAAPAPIEPPEGDDGTVGSA